MQILNDRMKKARKARRITQEQLAEMANVTRGMIARYETTNHLPSIDTLIRIADALDVSIDYLLGRAEFDSIYQEKGLTAIPAAKTKGEKSGLPATREELEQTIQSIVLDILRQHYHNASEK